MSFKDQGPCKGLNTNLWFDLYEQDADTATKTDKFCLACPFQSNCLSEGVRNGETGTWGAVYLNKGKYSKQHNRHKEKPLASIMTSHVEAIAKSMIT
ncbi:WhiB family transcription factor [Rhodococcus phage Weasels2]|uniref:WhiB family transcription factor n=1 Tax=Rhodococcus phage Weasels2 TaxID=1897437 RepID=A0A1I9SAH7_9CAUD|nr:WhiB transcription factor [Rhodococcus phage Weasels2]AOZ63783.1 WhiB family transcription factor [Rhodococcus phage Weasels2]